MKQIAIYGKGGIGKSTAATHLAYAIANEGKTVLQVGCDPQSDSTANLLTKFPKPILDVLAEHDFEYEDIGVDEILVRSPLPGVAPPSRQTGSGRGDMAAAMSPYIQFRNRKNGSVGVLNGRRTSAIRCLSSAEV